MVVGLTALALAPMSYAAPVYNIIDLAVVGSNPWGAQAFGASPDGSIIVGRSIGDKYATAYTWTAQTGMMALDNLAGRSYAMAKDVNNAGLVYDTKTGTMSSVGALPGGPTVRSTTRSATTAMSLAPACSRRALATLDPWGRPDPSIVLRKTLCRDDAMLNLLNDVEPRLLLHAGILGLG